MCRNPLNIAFGMDAWVLTFDPYKTARPQLRNRKPIYYCYTHYTQSIGIIPIAGRYTAQSLYKTPN